MIRKKSTINDRNDRIVKRAEQIKEGDLRERKRALMTPHQPSSRLFAGIRSVDLHEEIQRNGWRSETATITNDKHSRANASATTAVVCALNSCDNHHSEIAVLHYVHRTRKTNRKNPASVARWTLRVWRLATLDTIDTHVAIIFICFSSSVCRIRIMSFIQIASFSCGTIFSIVVKK